MSDDDGRSDRESRSGPLHLTGRAARTRFVIEVLALHHLDRLLLLTSSAEPPEVGPRHAAPHARYALLISFADAVSHLHIRLSTIGVNISEHLLRNHPLRQPNRQSLQMTLAAKLLVF